MTTVVRKSTLGNAIVSKKQVARKNISSTKRIKNYHPLDRIAGILEDEKMSTKELIKLIK